MHIDVGYEIFGFQWIECLTCVIYPLSLTFLRIILFFSFAFSDMAYACRCCTGEFELLAKFAQQPRYSVRVHVLSCLR